MKKKGSVILIETIIGIIIGIVFFVFIFSVAKDILTKGEDWETSFHEFATGVEAIGASGSGGEVDSFLLKVEDNTAVIGFNKKSAQTNGRFGDGGVHLVYRKGENIAFYDTGAKDVGSDIYHFPRPAGCPDDKNCMCLCRGPTAQGTSVEERSVLEIDTNKTTLYDSKEYLSYKDAFVYSTENHMSISCNELLCRSIGTFDYYTPLKNDYVIQQLPDTSAFRTDEQVDRFPGQPHFMYEGGFAIYRSDKHWGSSGSRILGFFSHLPASVPVTAAVVDGRRIAICLDNNCVQDIIKINLNTSNG